jgi:hypothetical protein
MSRQGQARGASDRGQGAVGKRDDDGELVGRRCRASPRRSGSCTPLGPGRWSGRVRVAGRVAQLGQVGPAGAYASPRATRRSSASWPRRCTGRSPARPGRAPRTGHWASTAAIRTMTPNDGAGPDPAQRQHQGGQDRHDQADRQPGMRGVRRLGEGKGPERRHGGEQGAPDVESPGTRRARPWVLDRCPEDMSAAPLRGGRGGRVGGLRNRRTQRTGC